jgi:hypothetical protein
MSWIAVVVPLMVVGVAVATVPLAYACHHQHKYGAHGSDPHRREASRAAATPLGQVGSSAVCPNCAALVVDQAMHDSSVHAIAVT